MIRFFPIAARFREPQNENGPHKPPVLVPVALAVRSRDCCYELRSVLGAPNGDSSFDFGLGFHWPFLLLYDFFDYGFKLPRDNGRVLSRGMNH